MMKKYLKFTLLTTLFVLSVSSVWATDSKQLADIGSKKAVALLRTLDKSTFKAYQSQLATEQQTLDFVQTMLVDKEEQVKIADDIRKEIADRHKDFNKLKELGTRYDIIWENVKLIGFDFDSPEESNQVVNGELYFSHGQQYYSTDFIAFSYDNVVYLFGFKGLLEGDAEMVSEFLNQQSKKQ